ncbi:MAG: hypothetical protein ACOY5Y_14785 [Pseudomonadota bacterium]|jgi:hypothetical protein
MLVSALAAIAMFAAPAAAEGGDKAQAKPAMVRVCQKIEAAGSAVPKKKCVMKPVKAAETAENAGDKGADVAKAE